MDKKTKTENKSPNATTSIITVDKLAYFYEKLKATLPTGGGAPPVGFVMDTFVKRNPALDYPGTTWTQITDGRVLVSGNSTMTGGSNTCTLTENQMPKHRHKTDVFEQVSRFITNPDSSLINARHIGDLISVPYMFVQGGGMSEDSGFVDGEMASSILGGSQSHSIQQAYQTIYRYRRTA